MVFLLEKKKIEIETIHSSKKSLVDNLLFWNSAILSLASP